jgi:hypothetical protein
MRVPRQRRPNVTSCNKTGITLLLVRIMHNEKIMPAPWLGSALETGGLCKADKLQISIVLGVKQPAFQPDCELVYRDAVRNDLVLLPICGNV